MAACMQENANLQTPIRPWLAQFYTESCVLTIFLELVMLSIAVSGSVECVSCASEATDDFLILSSKKNWTNIFLQL